MICSGCKKSDFKDGIISSIPIMLGYFFVSVGVGIYANKNTITPLQAALMSFTNLTSAGEISAIKIFGEKGGYIELLLSQIVINARYALMGISLSQKDFAKGFGAKSRAITSYGITDEIFAVIINKKTQISLAFTIPLIAGPVLSWTAGTLIGNIFASSLPENFISPLSILIYAMLISIIAPESKKNKPVMFACLFAALLSTTIFFFAKFITSGYSIIISSIIASSLCAILFPKELKEGEV